MPRPLVAHVLPRDLARGAQVYAGELQRLLDGRGADHVLLTLFRAEPGALGPHRCLDVPAGLMRRAGFDLRVLWKLRAVLRELRPQVVVTHGGEPLLYCVPVLPRATALVHYRIGVADHRLDNRLRRGVHRRAMARAMFVAGVSHATLDEAQRLFGLDAHRLRLVPNGRDPDRFRPGHDSRREPRLVFVGHLTATKRPEWFLSAVAALRARGIAVEAALIGDGPRTGMLAGRASRLGVELVGRSDDVPGQLARSDLLCFPSRTEGEGLPGVLIEAGMAGLATVTTDVPGARDVVEDGVTGLVVPVDDEAGFIAGIERLVVDGPLRSGMGQRARSRAAARFSMAASAKRWQRLLEEAMQGVAP